MYGSDSMDTVSHIAKLCSTVACLIALTVTPPIVLQLFQTEFHPGNSLLSEKPTGSRVVSVRRLSAAMTRISGNIWIADVNH